MSTVLAGPVLYDLADTAAVLRWYREVLPDLPRDVSGWFGVLTIPGGPPFPEELWGRKACGIVWCCTADAARAEEVMAPLRAFGSPLLDGMMSMPLSMMNSAFDALYTAGMQWYWRADFVGEISDDAIAIHEKFAAQLPTPLSTMHLYPIDGAVHDVRQGDTAFAYRNAGWAAVIVGVDPDPAMASQLRDWAVAYQEALHPTALDGAYINFMMDEGDGRVRASYGPNYDRLAQGEVDLRPGQLLPREPEHRPDPEQRCRRPDGGEGEHHSLSVRPPDLARMQRQVRRNEPNRRIGQHDLAGHGQVRRDVDELPRGNRLPLGMLVHALRRDDDGLVVLELG